MNMIALRPTIDSRRLLAILIAALLAALVTSTVFAFSRSQSAQGWAFLDGGMGRTDIESMDAEKGKYSLWVITAARVSGAYLADVDVSITDERGAKVFERRLQGPWLLIDLPLGRYEVRGRVGQETRGTVFRIGWH